MLYIVKPICYTVVVTGHRVLSERCNIIYLDGI